MKASKQSWQDSRPADWSIEWCPPPTFGTRRRPDRPTYGQHAAVVAKRLGTPYLPAQQNIADVALEYDPDTGLFFYSTVVVILPRQSGKTVVIILSLTVMRAILWPRQAIVYTAQDRNHARAKFEEDFVTKLDDAPGFTKDSDYTVRLANGSERLRFKNGSYIYISATGPNSGHSKTLNMAAVDEIWWHQTTDVDSGFRVPMITKRTEVPGAQMLLASAAGEEDRSVYMKGQRERGRAAVAADAGSGIAYFEYCCPEGLDPMDPANWWQWMPALGHTVREQDIAEELEGMDIDDWLRAYGGIDKPGSGGAGAKLTPAVWAEGIDPDSRIDDQAVIGVAVTPDRSQSSLCVAGRRSDGNVHVDHVKTAEGTEWLPGAVGQMVENFDLIAGVAFDGGGPASSINFGDLGKPLTVRGFGQACAALVDGVGQGRLFHRGQKELADAVARSKTKPLGDLWLWRRGDGDRSVAALEAATVALGGLGLVDEPADEAASPIVERGGLFSWD